MIKEITLKNFKSFKNLNYKFENINIFIGGNGSGKSNFLDALEFIKLLTNNPNDNKVIEKIRGTSKFLKTFNQNELTVGVIANLNEKKDFEYNYSLDTNNIISDRIKDTIDNKEIPTMDSKTYSKLKSMEVQITKELETIKFIENIDIKQFIKFGKEFGVDTVGLQKVHERASRITKTQKNVKEKTNQIKNHLLGIETIEILKQITILDPIPREIRGESKLTTDVQLIKDCSNLISYVINSKIKGLEENLLKYLKILLGENIQKIEFKILGKNKEFCQLYIHEKIGNKIETLHSDIVSDGTLRFISIIVALLSQKKGSILAIEEFDNGIAPSKVKILLDIIDEISLEREIDVLITTHNTSLINYISKKLFDFIFYVYKNDSGYSNIKRIKDIERVAKMLSYGEIGELMEENKIIEFIKLGESNE